MELFAPRGTNDILPGEVEHWHELEKIVRETFELYGYREARLPIFEHTELFARGVGDTTDIVQKEMYTFEDRSGRSLTLRPEGTAQVVRAYLQHKMHGMAQPVKLYYMGPMFRYERPQKGRYRQLHQFGAEALGSDSPLLDAELIALPNALLTRLGLDEVDVHINSIGCATCRPVFRDKLRAHLEKGKDQLCPSCLDRLERNPLRVLDCKNKTCQKVAAGGPHTLDHICDSCQDHFEEVKKGLDELGMSYIVNPNLVRGLDYYSRTVYEFIGKDLGAQNTVAAGGRYDGLVEAYGGPATPSVGFAAGSERLLLSLRAKGILPEKTMQPYVYLAVAGDEGRFKALELAVALRQHKIYAELDFAGRSLRAQMRAAQRSGAAYVVIIGENELTTQRFIVKQMDTGEETEVPMNEMVAWLEGTLDE